MLWQLSSKHGTTIETVLYFLHFWNFSSNCKTFEMVSRLVAIFDAISIDTISNAYVRLVLAEKFDAIL